MISVPSFLGNHIYVLKNPLFHSTLYRVAPNQGGKVASGYNLPMAWSNPSRAANKEIELFQLFGFRPGHSSKLVQLPHGYGMVWVYVLFMSFALLHWLMVDLPLWKIWKSVGMIIPNIWKVLESHKSHVPNHQPVQFKIRRNNSPRPANSRVPCIFIGTSCRPERLESSALAPSSWEDGVPSSSFLGLPTPQVHLGEKLGETGYIKNHKEVKYDGSFICTMLRELKTYFHESFANPTFILRGALHGPVRSTIIWSLWVSPLAAGYVMSN